PARGGRVARSRIMTPTRMPMDVTNHSRLLARPREPRRSVDVCVMEELLLDESDDCHRGGVAGTVAQLVDPRVTAGAIREARADLVEQLREDLPVPDLPCDQAPRMQIPALRLRD